VHEATAAARLREVLRASRAMRVADLVIDDLADDKLFHGGTSSSISADLCKPVAGQPFSGPDETGAWH